MQDDNKLCNLNVEIRSLAEQEAKSFKATNPNHNRNLVTLSF